MCVPGIGRGSVVSRQLGLINLFLKLTFDAGLNIIYLPVNAFLR
jgi:hypothetical protein